MNTSSRRNVRVAFLGSGGVGKTSIIHRLIGKDLPMSYSPTLYDVYIKVIAGNKICFSLELIDTAGYHNFPAMLDLAIGRADVLVFVYSVVDESSIKHMYQLKKRVVETRGFFPMETPMVVIANKVDLSNRESCMTMRYRAGSLEDEFANWGTSFLATSSKLNFGMSSVMHFLRDEGECCVRLKEMSPLKNCPTVRGSLDDDVFEAKSSTSEREKRRLSKSFKRMAVLLARAGTEPIRRASRKLSKHAGKKIRRCMSSPQLDTT